VSVWQPVVACGCELGERPVLDPRSGALWWVDIPSGDLHRLDGDGRHTIRSVGAPLGAVALRAGAGVVAASGNQMVLLDEQGDVAAEPIPLEFDAGLRFNDGAVDPAGRMLIGTTSVRAESGRAALYRVDRAGAVDIVLDGLTESNGLGWAPDGRTLYFVDSVEPVIRRYEYGPDGTVRRGHDLVTLAGSAAGSPDGLVVDAEGAVWVALWGGGELRRYSPDGERVEAWPVPVSQPTCPALGADGTVYLTTAWEGLSLEARAAQPWAGHLLSRQLPCRPQRAHYFADPHGSAAIR
jgi:sugar lactone lactonase YvrE